jgi:hypothetical protein
MPIVSRDQAANNDNGRDCDNRRDKDVGIANHNVVYVRGVRDALTDEGTDHSTEEHGDN